MGILNPPLNRKSVIVWAAAICCLTILSVAHSATYPLQIDLVDKANTNFDSPENTYAAMMSAMMSNDETWYYSCFTVEGAKKTRQMWADGNIGIQMVFDSVKTVKTMEVLEKGSYGDGVYLLLRVTDQDGSVMTGPSLYVQENGLWKSTPEIPIDAPILDKLDYTAPPDFLIPYALSVFPNKWSLTWYNWLASHSNPSKVVKKFAKHANILCVLTQEDINIPVDEIDLSTLRLNNDVPVKPWRYFSWQSLNWESTEAVIIDPNNSNRSRYHKQFNKWRNALNRKIVTEQPFLLARFNKFEAMKSLNELQADTDYDVIISGKLKDGKEFKAKATITVTERKQRHRRWFHWKSKPPFHADYIDLWWNK